MIYLRRSPTYKFDVGPQELEHLGFGLPYWVDTFSKTDKAQAFGDIESDLRRLYPGIDEREGRENQGEQAGKMHPY